MENMEIRKAAKDALLAEIDAMECRYFLLVSHLPTPVVRAAIVKFFDNWLNIAPASYEIEDVKGYQRMIAERGKASRMLAEIVQFPEKHEIVVDDISAVLSASIDSPERRKELAMNVLRALWEVVR